MLDLLGRKSAIVTVLKVMSRDQLSQSVACEGLLVDTRSKDARRIFPYTTDIFFTMLMKFCWTTHDHLP